MEHSRLLRSPRASRHSQADREFPEADLAPHPNSRMVRMNSRGAG